jgi:hypothetical protein
MFADVYSNTEAKRAQINNFITSLLKLIKTPGDAEILAPIIKDFLEVNVKNDEHIVRLVQIAQRLVSVNNLSDTGLLTEAEKQQILKNVKMEFEQVLEEKEDIQESIDELK